MTHSLRHPSRRGLLGALALAPAALAMPTILGSGRAFADTAEPALTAPAGAVIRHRIGDIEVLALADGFGPVPTNVLLGLKDDAARRAAALAHKPHDPVNTIISINAYVIRTGSRTILVDAGAGNAMGPTLGALHNSLVLAGIAAGDIDTVFLTHGHVDHVGGLTGPAGERLLPNAQLVAAEAEWAFTHDEAVFAAIPEAFRPSILASRAQLAPYAGGREMLSMNKQSEIAPGVTAIPLPGHTPGHMGLEIASNGASLVIWGDIVHAPAYQFSHPDWSVAFDSDATTAIASRTRMFDMAATNDSMVAGMHLDFPALGYVERRDDAYRYVAAPPDFGA